MGTKKLPAAEEKTTAVVPLKPKPPTVSNPYLEAASEGGSNVGERLTFSKGKWKIGGEQVADGTEFVAHINQSMRGWTKYQGGKAVDRRVGMIRDRFAMPEREQLGDNDPVEWLEGDNNGKPKDPWAKQYFVPMINRETGELVTYTTSSAGGIKAVNGLLQVYGFRANGGKLPIVSLAVREYRHPQFGDISTPKFVITGWDEEGAGGPAPTLAEEMDDEIPDLEFSPR